MPTPLLQTPVDRALDHLAALQQANGMWEGEMVWNTMLLSQWVLVRRVTATVKSASAERQWPLSDALRENVLQHYRVTQLADGSWPMHGEGHGYVFMTTMAYVALRVLGISADDPLLQKALDWLRARPANGGVEAIPTWGKIWLSMFGLYGWQGVNPIPPELFLLPSSAPMHPDNYYCHTRYIYLGIAYLYGRRFSFDLGAITDELRGELYGREWAQIDFAAHRHEIAATDLFVAPSLFLKSAYEVLRVYEKLPYKPLRPAALAHCLRRIVFEQEASRGQGLSPVNGLLNSLALFSNDPSDPLLAESLDAMDSWKWQDEAEGARFCGAHSTSWDTAFALRAIAAAPHATEAAIAAARTGYAWLCDAQMKEELVGGEVEHRQSIVGGWCFSDGAHRWPVSDCTAEALSALFDVEDRGLLTEGTRRIDALSVKAAVRFILSRQNDDGGFGTYERRRGSVVLEWVNPSEMYDNCMTERSYTECTASCIGALSRYLQRFGRDLSIEQAVARGVSLLRSRQLDDGSYAGFWGVNFTYGIFHVVEALRAAGVSVDDPAIARAAEWLIRHQKSDGGWGEHFSSCLSGAYVEHPVSQAAMTAWALLALLESVPATTPAVQRAVRCLEAMQQSDGGWPAQAQSGVFFSTAMLDYRMYRDYFPAWALGRALQLH